MTDTRCTDCDNNACYFTHELSEGDTMTDNERIMDRALTDMDNRLVDAKNDIAMLREAFDRLVADNAALRQELQDANSENGSLTFIMTTLSKDKDELRVKYDSLKEEYSNMSQANRQLAVDRDTALNSLTLACTG